jgi:type I restriction enzyme, S subunit
MTQWQTAKLEDVVQILGGGTPSRTEESYFGGGIAWATPTDITSLDGLYISATKETITETGLKNSSTKLMPSGSVLLTSRATIGFTAVSQVPICTNQGFVNFICGPDLVPEYLAYWLKTQKAKFIQHAGGTTFKEIARGVVRKFEISFPPIPEQRRIVDILSRVEGIVRLRREAQKKASEIIPALFIDMFGDPTTNPKDWAKMPLENLCARITDGTHQPPKFQGSGIPFIFISNIVRGELTFDTSKFISDETYTELTRRCPIEIGDVLYSTVGSYGVPVKVDTDRRFSFQRHIAHIKPHRDKLDSDFLVGMLSTPSLKAQADAAARGIAQKTVNLGEIRKYQVIAPPLETQRSFSSQVAAARSIQFQQSAATAKAEATFNALLGQMFDGFNISRANN